MSRATFPAAARLHRPTEFAAALSGRRISRGAFFVVTAHSPAQRSGQPAFQSPSQPTAIDGKPVSIETDIAEVHIARLGLIMAKRFAHHASTRNTLKRVIRESFRALRLNLPPKDYVVRLHKPVGKMSLTQLKLMTRLETDAHFRKAQQ